MLIINKLYLLVKYRFNKAHNIQFARRRKILVLYFQWFNSKLHTKYKQQNPSLAWDVLEKPWGKGEGSLVPA